MWQVFDCGGERAASVTSVRRLQKLAVLDRASGVQDGPATGQSCWEQLCHNTFKKVETRKGSQQHSLERSENV